MKLATCSDPLCRSCPGDGTRVGPARVVPATGGSGTLFDLFDPLPVIDDSLPWLRRSDPDWLDVPPTEVRLAALGFAQSHVSVRGLVAHARAIANRSRLPGHDPSDEYPRVVAFRDRLWVVDGAHRVAASLVRDRVPTILARVRRWPWHPGDSPDGD